LGATPIESVGRAPNEILTCIKRVKKVKEDLDSAITTIRREFILVKVGQPEDFSELKQSNKAATYDSRVASSR
jgi:hypothetical protein